MLINWNQFDPEHAAEGQALLLLIVAGVNLAAAFPVNPFSDAFAALWNAVAAKQEYETRQVKTLFHGPEGAVDMEATVALTEKVRAPRVEAVKKARHPVTHTMRIQPVP